MLYNVLCVVLCGVVWGADVFTPTHQWQQIKPGQSIPRGLHVRINLETGYKEAKLLSDDDKSESSNSVVNVPPSDDVSGVDYNGELKQAIHDIKKKNKEAKLRTSEEIRATFEEMQMSVKSDAEAMKRLISRYMQKPEVSILSDLEYYVHQIDNANDFVRMGGFTHVVIPALNSSDAAVVCEGALLLGSSLQSNPGVQLAAVESGLLHKLLLLLSRDSSGFLVRKRSLYALSCLLRRSQPAQTAFIQHGGLHVLQNLYKHTDENAKKLQVKVATLVQDLMIEDDSGEVWNNTALQSLCPHIPPLLTHNTDHDVVEKVLAAMLTMSTLCKHEFIKHEALINNIADVYAGLAKPNRDQYFISIRNTAINLLISIKD